MVSRSYFVTGANSGCGLEAARQLAIRFSADYRADENAEGTTSCIDDDDDIGAPTIYLLCRSEEKARDAIEDIRESIRADDRGRIDEKAVRLKFMKFDAYDDEAAIRENISLALGDDGDDDETAVDDPETPRTVIGGMVLNAGGFGDARAGSAPAESAPPDENNRPAAACGIAKLNLLGHVFLVRQLLALGTADASTRVIAVGSEAAIVTPWMDLAGADFVAHLEGAVPLYETAGAKDYGWIKSILALYWAAFARRHPGLYVVTVSPGGIPSTSLLKQGAVSRFTRLVALTSTLPCFGGSHSVADGARRYVDALLGEGDVFGAENPPPSGTFLASRRGFAGDFGDVSELKRGAFVDDRELQDRAWAAVERFLPRNDKKHDDYTNATLHRLVS